MTLPTHFWLKKTLHSLRKQSPKIDSRLPITLTILELLNNASQKVIGSYVERVLFQCMMTVAFYGLLRVGEITVSKSSFGGINTSDLTWNTNASSVSISLSDYKHSAPGKVHFIQLKSQANPNLCPLLHLKRWLATRPSDPGLLFTLADGKGISRDWFVTYLHRCLLFCNLDPKFYKGHSFRIGGACHAALILGFSDSQIRLLGRWKSDAFKKYIRNPSL